MNETFQAILDSLPPKASRSKLEPYTELIHELRFRGRSYREITGILADRCGVHVGVHTLYNFVRVRTKAGNKANRAGKNTVAQAAPPARPSPPVAAGPSQPEAWDRIQALKQRAVPARAPGAEKIFHYDENVPLTVNRKKDDV